LHSANAQWIGPNKISKTFKINSNILVIFESSVINCQHFKTTVSCWWWKITHHHSSQHTTEQ